MLDLKEYLEKTIRNCETYEDIQLATRNILLLIYGAALEEARWWEHLVGAQLHLLGQDDCEPNCMYCERIRNIEKKIDG